MKSLVFLDRAHRNLEEIREISEGKWGTRVWARRAHALDEAFERLKHDPSSGQKRDDLMKGMRSLTIAPHIAFFIERDDAVAVLRIVDGRRDLPGLDFGTGQ